MWQRSQNYEVPFRTHADFVHETPGQGLVQHHSVYSILTIGASNNLCGLPFKGGGWPLRFTRIFAHPLCSGHNGYTRQKHAGLRYRKMIKARGFDLARIIAGSCIQNGSPLGGSIYDIFKESTCMLLDHICILCTYHI